MRSYLLLYAVYSVILYLVNNTYYSILCRDDVIKGDKNTFWRFKPTTCSLYQEHHVQNDRAASVIHYKSFMILMSLIQHQSFLVIPGLPLLASNGS